MTTDANESPCSSHPSTDAVHSSSAGVALGVSERPEQTGLFHSPTASEDAQAKITAGTCSATPNARASRLFRERRKEREKVLRDTVAQLAERNMALENLLLSHGITPPFEATLKKDLAVHKSQDSGGPPIHIPGLTSARPPSIESTNSQSVSHSDGHPYHGFHQRLSSSTSSSFMNSSCSSGRSHGSSFHAPSETSYCPDTSLGISSSLPDSSSRTVSSEQAFCGMLQTHAEAVSPTNTVPVQGPHLASRMRPFQLTNPAIAGTHAPLTSSSDGSKQMSSTMTQFFEPLRGSAAAGWP